METFISSTPSPAGFAGPPSGLGGQAASTDAQASVTGLFLQIFSNSCAGEAPAGCEPEEAPPEGKVVAETPTPAVPLIVMSPPGAQEPLPESEVAVSGEGVPTGRPVDPGAGLFAAAQDAPVRAVQPSAGNGQTVPAQAAPAAAAGGAGGEHADAAPSDAPAPDASAVRAPAADPVPTASRDSRSSRPEEFSPARERFDVAPAKPSAAPGMDPAAGRPGPQDATLRMEPAVSRLEPPAAAPTREAESDPAGAVVRDVGNPPASGKEDPEPFSFTLAREKASADKATEKGRVEDTTLPSARETAEPGASHAIAAGRNAAEAASGPRPPAPAPAAHPQRTFHAGENAFVLTRKSDTSVEITLSPPGVGRLEIEVFVDKGVVHANITAADPAGREAIERSLPQIVQALADEGMAIGGFTVSLKQGDGQDGDAQAANAQAGKRPGSGSSGADAPGAVRSAAGRSGLVDIFV